MPLMPKRVKYRKTQRGVRAGTATRNIYVSISARLRCRRSSAPGSPTPRSKPPVLRLPAT